MTKARDIASAIPAPSTVSSAELGYLDGVTSAIQTQIDTKAPSSTAVTLTGTQTLTNKTLTSPVIASVINNTLTSTTGDIIYASGANTPARLGIGSTGNVLTVAGGIPSWAAPAGGGGKVLQVVSAVTSTDVDISTSTQTDTGITATITPTVNTSKILIIISANAIVSGANPGEAGARVMRDSTSIHTYGDYAFHRAGSASGGNAENLVNHSITFLDSPATTSATTYKLQAKIRTSGSIRFQFLSTAPSTITLLEIGV